MHGAMNIKFVRMEVTIFLFSQELFGDRLDLRVCLQRITFLVNCAFLGYYGASSSNFLPTIRDNLSVPFSGIFGFLTPEDGT
jgi:hypothetical protein